MRGSCTLRHAPACWQASHPLRPISFSRGGKRRTGEKIPIFEGPHLRREAYRAAPLWGYLWRPLGIRTLGWPLHLRVIGIAPGAHAGVQVLVDVGHHLRAIADCSGDTLGRT
jgi:hypothetical protein